MSAQTTHRAFFGDQERDFCITPALIPELERLTETGIGELCKRLFTGDFHHADMIETIRLGLIGGGASPQEATIAVRTYAHGRPLQETLPLAVDILSAVWFGVATRKEGDADA